MRLPPTTRPIASSGSVTNRAASRMAIFASGGLSLGARERGASEMLRGGNRVVDRSGREPDLGMRSLNAPIFAERAPRLGVALTGNSHQRYRLSDECRLDMAAGAQQKLIVTRDRIRHIE